MGRWKKQKELYNTIIWDFVEERDGKKDFPTGAKVILSPYNYSKYDKWQVTITTIGYNIGSSFFRTKKKAWDYAQKYMRRNPNG